jgi:hypothetical protein
MPREDGGRCRAYERITALQLSGHVGFNAQTGRLTADCGLSNERVTLPWRNVANLRVQGNAKRMPAELLLEQRSCLLPLPAPLSGTIASIGRDAP